MARNRFMTILLCLSDSKKAWQMYTILNYYVTIGLLCIDENMYYELCDG